MSIEEFQLGSISTLSDSISSKSMSIDKILKLSEELKKVSKSSGKWILISDTGKVYLDNPEELLLVLAPYHPLLKSLNSNENGFLK